MKSIPAGCIVVLLQISAYSVWAQTVDTGIVFSDNSKLTPLAEPEHSRLGAIASVAFGSYNAFRNDGQYATYAQGIVGFDFLAEPGGGLHLLFGGRLGIPSPISTEINFGARLPLHQSSDRSIRIFADLGLLFFDDASDSGAPHLGVRAAFGARTVGPIDLEYRLAAEYRGTESRTVDGDRSRPLWWVGAEIGVAFDLVSAYKAPSRKDSLRASLHYIASTEEMQDLEAASSRAELDDWLERFWKKRDMTPGTYLNEARIEFDRRSKEANERFSAPKRLGVLTDPGRALVVYGNPDDYESAEGATNESHRYVMWIYRKRINTQPLAVFLFQTDRPREWRQVYSNVPGEMSGSLPYGLPARMTRWIQ